MVEAIANSVEDKLIDGLSFKLAPGASYVQDRKSVTYHPQGSNVYSPAGGTKLIKMLITGEGWVDPSTFRIMFDLQNNEASPSVKQLRPIGGPWCFFRRLRILMGGTVVEDITEYNRIHEMFSILTATDSRINTDMEGFGMGFNIGDNTAMTLDTTTTPDGIQADSSQTVLFKPLSGLFNQNKFLPVKYSPITIELELVHDKTEPVVTLFGTGDDDFKATNTTDNWEINNVQAKLDLITLDNGYENQYTEHLLEGRSFPINYNTYVSQIQKMYGNGTNGQESVRLNVSRALTRLKSVFVTLDKDLANTKASLKEWNSFYSPMNAYAGVNNKFDKRGEFEYQLQVGSKLFPEFPIRSHAEAYYQLKKTLGVQSSAVHSFDINAHEYRTTKLVLGLDLERVLEAGFTGLNTRAGDLMSILFNHSDATETNWATSMHIVLHSDNILEISNTGVSVYD